jgi:spore germination cell wall hydrolase CwlJ-like protein
MDLRYNARIIDSDMDLRNAQHVLAGTAWGEARGDGPSGMQAVCNVVMNRVARGGWWGATVLEVCLKPWQFSCWNADDPNRAKIMNLHPVDSDYAVALGLALKGINGSLPDITGGADSYYDLSMPSPPSWAAGLEPCATIGSQAFFRTEGPPASATADDLNAAELAALSGGQT